MNGSGATQENGGGQQEQQQQMFNKKLVGYGAFQVSERLSPACTFAARSCRLWAVDTG
jgi:hypothetical protein